MEPRNSMGLLALLARLYAPLPVGGRMRRGCSQPPGTRKANRARRKAERQRRGR